MDAQRLQKTRKVLGPDHTSVLDTVNHLGVVYETQGKLAEAEEMYKKAMGGYEKALRTEHTLMLGTVKNFGGLYADQRKLVQAEEIYKQALQGYEQALGAEHTSTYIPVPNTIWGVGSHIEHQADLEKFQSLYSNALLGYGKLVGLDNLRSWNLRDSLCADCEEIDFHAAGLHVPDAIEYDNLHPYHVSLLDVMEREDRCLFCGIVTRAFTEWAQESYGGVERLIREESMVRFQFEQTGRLQQIKDYELREINELGKDGDNGAVIHDNSDNDGNRDESTSEFSNHFRLRVSWDVKNLEGKSIANAAYFQKCATEDNHVASLFNNTDANEWPDQKEPYIGRIRPLVADCRLFRKWKDYCISSHGAQCRTPINGPTAFRIRLIEVKQECIVELTENVKWVALSYVWGKSKNLILEEESFDQFKRPGFLSRDRVPKTVYDAMVLTAAIGEKYLWVDSICIIQNNDLDKSEFIPRMDAIFSHSVLTIIDAAGTDSRGGLPGIENGTRTKVQTPFTLKGATLVQTLDPIYKEDGSYLTKSNWNARGWTFQEGLLSPRTLIFTKEQVYWQCSQASWCEDGFWECPSSPTMYRHGLAVQLRYVWSPNPLLVEKRYRQLVEMYSQRELSYESDGLDAFRGILKMFEQMSGLEFLWGLPTFYLGAALTWPALGQDKQVRRRIAICKYKDSFGNIVECPLPSWSWVGWVGKIYYEECFGLLTSRHAGLVFHKIYPDGATEIIQQNVEFMEKRGRSRRKKEEPDIPHPIWRDESQTAIMRSDIPSSVFLRNFSAIVLGFWSSTAIVTLHYGGEDLWGNTILSILQNGIKFQAIWGQCSRHPTQMEFELARLIIIGRSTLSPMWAEEHLVAIMADLEPDEGLTYRRAMVTIRESEWNKLKGKVWSRIFLA